MVEDLKKKSLFAYIIIGLIFIVILSITNYLAYTEKYSATKINIAGQQGVLTQRIALLCNNYYSSSSDERIKLQIQKSLEKLEENHAFIKSIDSKKVSELLYDSRYQYDNLLKEYIKNIRIFVSSKSIKHLKIINYTNESLLTIANTLVELLNIEYDEFNELFMGLISVFSVLFIAMLYFIYRTITLKSILTTHNALLKLNSSKKLLIKSQKISQLLSWNMNVDTRLLKFSDTAKGILGINRDSIGLDEFLDYVVEKDLERLSRLFDDAISYGVSFNTEVVLSVEDKYIYLEIFCEGVIEGSSVEELYGIVQNVTQKAAMLQEMKVSLDMIDKNVITSQTDIEGKLIHVSSAYEKISDFKEEELVGKAYSITSHTSMPKETFYDLWLTITAGKVWSGEVRNRKKDNSFYWTNTTISPKFDLNNNIVGYISVKEDITDKKLLEENEIFINSILDNSALAVIATRTDGVITLFNKAAENMLGYKAEDLIGKETLALFHKSEEVVKRANELSEEFSSKVEPGFGVFVEKTNRGLKNSDEWTYVSKDSKELIVKLNITSFEDSEGEINGYIGIAEDITELKEKEREIENYLDLIDKNILTSSTDINGNITFVSEAFVKISGYSKEELIGQNHRIIKHEEMDSSLYEDLWKTIIDDKVWRGDIKNRAKDGSSFWVDMTISPIYDISGVKIGYTALRQDITDKKMVELLSITDALTGLYNRRHFNNVSQIEIDRAKRNSSIFAFTLLDIDNFKKYNDTYGHQEGDNVLTQIAKSLKDTFKRSGDTVFRLGGEEFGVILTANFVEDAASLVERARANIEALNIEHLQNNPSKRVTASFGLFVASLDNSSDKLYIDTIYKDADEMLYEAKKSGRNRVVVKER